jgi:hypothetical protein
VEEGSERRRKWKREVREGERRESKVKNTIEDSNVIYMMSEYVDAS